ncbi:MAG TPA: winged helix DNA-binding domain-containing protein [Anaerolineae bacterium]
MTEGDFAQWRLASQRIAPAMDADPAAVVGRLAAVQAQDYGAAKWAVGLRTAGATDSALEQAFANGAILRTHLLRPTWHFILPADIRWLLSLTAPRVKTALAYNDRRLGVDAGVISRSNAVLARALEGGKQLTRSELATVLAGAGIATNDLRLGHLLFHAELDGVVCSGARRGKQFTYMLLEERVPPAPVLSREESLARVARRYFTSRGPAALKDFVWWSGLTVADARAGLEMVKPELGRAVVDGTEYWFGERPPDAARDGPVAHLLPNFDEFVVGYADRSAVFEERHTPALGPRSSVLMTYIIVIEGQVAGTWRRTFEKGAVAIDLKPFFPLTAAETEAVEAAAERFGAFLGLPAQLV